MLILWGAFASGCNETPPAELATLESLSPLEIEVGEDLTLRGSGFIVGDATLLLDGTLSAPGRASNDAVTQLRLPVLATSPTRAVARLGRRHIESLDAAHITFSGRAVLRFESAAGPDAPPVVATHDDVRLELFASTMALQADSRRAQEQGLAVLDELGISANVLPEGRGLLIERTLSSSPGADAGLNPGEVIVAAGNVTVSSISDLAPAPHADRIVLGLRTTDGRFRRVACPIAQTQTSLDRDRVAALAIACSALALLLFVAGPLRGLSAWCGARVNGGGLGPRTLLTRLATASRDHPFASGFSLMLFAAAPFVVMALAHYGVVLVAGLVLLASIILAVTTNKGWWRLLAAPLSILRVVPLFMGVAAAAVHSTTMELTQIVSEQSAAPWGWIALQSPTTLALLLIAMATTCSGDHGPPRATTALYRGLAGALVAATLLGGWTAPGESALWGQVAFAAKTWSIGLLFAYGGRSQYLLSLPIAAALLAGSIALAVLSLPPWLTAAAPWLAGAAALFLVLPLTLRHILLAPVETGRSSKTQQVFEDPPLSARFEISAEHSKA